jgi:hypothetical protein
VGAMSLRPSEGNVCLRGAEGGRGGAFQKEVRENVLSGFSEVHFVAHVTAVNVRTKVLFDCLKVLFYFCEV